MYHIIKFDLKKDAPTILNKFFGGIRIRYHFMLLKPKGNGEILKEWRGNNWDKEKDEFSSEFKGNDLKFAPLSWQFEVYPNPGIPGEKYKIDLHIKQGEQTIFSKEYEQNPVSKPEIITEDAVFVPMV